MPRPTRTSRTSEARRRAIENEVDEPPRRPVRTSAQIDRQGRHYLFSEDKITFGGSLLTSSEQAYCFMIGLDRVWFPKSAVSFITSEDGSLVPKATPSMLSHKGITVGQHRQRDYPPSSLDEDEEEY